MTTTQSGDTSPFKAFEYAGWQAVTNQYRNSFVELTRQTVEPMLDAVSVVPGTRLLDVACGPGFLASEAAKRGARAMGIDFSPKMVALAHQLYPEVTFLVGDAEGLPFPESSFDTVVMNFGLLHFERPEQALEEAYRVLRAEGKLALTVWDQQKEAVGFDIPLRAVQSHGNLKVPLPPGPPFFRFSDPLELERTLREVGFAQPKLAHLPLVWHLPATDSLFEMMMTASVRMGGLLQRQSPEALAVIRDTMREATRVYERNGVIELPMSALFAVTEKKQR